MDNQISKDLVPKELLDNLDLLIRKINALYDADVKLMTAQNEKIKTNKTLSDTIEDLYSKNDELSKLSKQYEEQEKKLSAEVINYNKAQQEAYKIAQLQAVINNEQAGHIKKLSAEMSLLKIQRDNLNKSDKDYEQQVKKINTELDKLGEEHKSLMSVREQDKINVGNYKDALKGAVGDIRIFGVSIGELKNKFSTASGGVQSMGKSLGMLKTAIISTGIGALIVLLGSLYTWFTKTEEGSEALERGQARLGQAFSIIIGVVNNVIQWFKKLYTEHEQIFNVIGKITAITNPFIGAMALVGKAFKNATEEAAYYTKILQDVEDEENNNAAAMEVSRGKIEQLLLSVKQRDLTEQQRLKNLDEASAIEKKMFDEELLRAQKRADAEKGLADIKRKSGEISEGNLGEEESKALTKLAEMKNQQLILEQKIANRRSLLQEQFATETKKATDEQITLSEKLTEKKNNDLIAQYKYAMLKEKEGSAAYLNAKIKLLEIEKNVELQNKDLTANEKKVIEQNYANSVLEISEKYFKDKEADTKAQTDKDLAEAQKMIDGWKEIYGEKYDTFKEGEEELTKVQFDENLIKLQQEIEHQREIVNAMAISIEEKKKMLKALDDYEKQLSKDKKDREKEDKEEEQEAADEKLKTQEEYFKEISNLIKTSSALYNTLLDRQLAKENKETNRKLLNLEKEKEARIAAGEDEKLVAEDVDKRKQEIENNAAVREAELRRKQAIMDKVTAAFDIAINTIANSIKVSYNPVLMALIIAEGVLAEAAVLAKPLPEIPQFKKGVKGFGGGLAILHGGELVNTGSEIFMTSGGVDDPIPAILPSGTDVISNEVIMNDLRAITMKGNLKGNDDDIRAIKELAAAYRDKKEVHVNIDENGMRIFTKQAHSKMQWINKYRQ